MATEKERYITKGELQRELQLLRSEMRKELQQVLRHYTRESDFAKVKDTVDKLEIFHQVELSSSKWT